MHEAASLEIGKTTVKSGFAAIPGPRKQTGRLKTQGAECRLANGWIYRILPVGRGDVVVVRSQTHWCGSGDAVIKRVIGIPGDRVKVAGRAVVVNGRAAVPRASARSVPGRVRALRLGAGRYFLVGDNTTASCDSRSRGAVPRDTIVGKVILISSPFERIRLLGDLASVTVLLRHRKMPML